MSLVAEDIQRVAKLARLGLTDTETTQTLDKLNAILGLIDQMQSINTEGVEPMAHPLELNQILRVDQVTESDHRAQYQSVAPAAEDGLYLVPRVVE